MVLAAAVVTVPAIADVTDLSRIPGATAKAELTSSGTVRGTVDNIRDGTFGSTSTFLDSNGPSDSGWFYVLWQDVQTVQTVRWFTSGQASTRGLTAFTLWSLQAGANPDLDTSWNPIGTYSVANGDFDGKFAEITLTGAVKTQAVKLSYADQSSPLTGGFELYDQVLTRLAATVVDSSGTAPSVGAVTATGDGDMFTSWASVSMPDPHGFMEFALVDGKQEVGGLQIYFRKQGATYVAPSAFTLTAWDDDADDGAGGWAAAPFASVTDWAETAETFTLNLPAGVCTSKIRLDVTARASTWPSAGGYGFGIAEMIFYAPAIPEPATMTLLTLGGLAMLRRRR
jgi:hypothetical protein